MNDVDWSQRTAGELGSDHDDPLNDPLVRALRTRMPYFYLWNRPAEEIAAFRDGLRRAMLGDTAVEAEAQKPGESKNTSPDQDALLLQNRARGQRFTTDRRVGSVAAGESQPDSEEVAIRRRQQTNAQDYQDDFEYFGRDGAARWNAMRRKL